MNAVRTWCMMCMKYEINAASLSAISWPNVSGLQLSALGLNLWRRLPCRLISTPLMPPHTNPVFASCIFSFLSPFQIRNSMLCSHCLFQETSRSYVYFLHLHGYVFGYNFRTAAYGKSFMTIFIPCQIPSLDFCPSFGVAVFIFLQFYVSGPSCRFEVPCPQITWFLFKCFLFCFFVPSHSVVRYLVLSLSAS